MVESTVSIPQEAVKVMKSQSKQYEYFSASQVKLLIETLKQNPYLPSEEMKALAVRMQTSFTKIQRWFSWKRYKIRTQKVDDEGNQYLEHTCKGDVFHACKLEERH